MTSVDEAWDWYLASKKQMQQLRRLAKRYWAELPWDGKLGRDNVLCTLEADEVAAQAELTLAHLDDLAIVVLFSVFEARVREFVAIQVRLEARSLRHVALRRAASEVIEAIEQGSFGRLTEPFKELDHDLVEEVSQVRRYRNWVAHGKRGDRPATVDPQVAHERLRRFLTMLADD